MARPRAEALPDAFGGSLLASSSRLSSKTRTAYTGTGEQWQQEAYRHYAICGEARFAARYFGNALSRARIFVDKPNDDQPMSEGEANDLLQILFSRGQSRILSAVGENLTIAGECYLIGRTVSGSLEADIEGDVWEVVSPLEVSVSGGVWTVTVEGKSVRLNDDSDTVIRIWNPMPGDRHRPDSPFRALLPVLSEIEWATRHIFRQLSSRLAGSGVLFLPNSMSFPPPVGKDGEALELANVADSFMVTLANGMMEGIEDPSSPSNTVPLIVTADGDEIDKAKLMTFWSDLDASILELRTAGIQRFALGMDLPPEQVLGMGANAGTGGGRSMGVNHWTSWQVEEDTIKMHIEPMLQALCDALTYSYLHPLLERKTDEYVAFDTSALRLRPDRSKESIELYNLGLIKPEIVVQENGFDPKTEMMNDAELKRWLLKKIASGSSTPEQVHAALAALGVVLDVAYETDSEPRETPQPPSLKDHPTRERTPDRLALLAACDTLVWRALEKAGNRHLTAGLRGKDRDKTIEPTEFHLRESINGEGPSLLDGAFKYGPRVLDGLCENPNRLLSVLQNYCLALFATQTPHTRVHLAEYLEAQA